MSDFSLTVTESNMIVQVIESTNTVIVTDPSSSQLLTIQTEGAQGPRGYGVPLGGTTNQYLRKASNTDLDTEWDSLATVANSGDHADLSNIGTNTHAQIDSHIANTSNPHSVTKSQVGLGNVDNTSDINKPVSTAQQIAIDAKVADAINDGVSTVAPSQNAVFDALALKADDSNTVHKTGNETITGFKEVNRTDTASDNSNNKGFKVSLYEQNDIVVDNGATVGTSTMVSTQSNDDRTNWFILGDVKTVENDGIGNVDTIAGQLNQANQIGSGNVSGIIGALNNAYIDNASASTTNLVGSSNTAENINGAVTIAVGVIGEVLESGTGTNANAVAFKVGNVQGTNKRGFLNETSGALNEFNETTFTEGVKLDAKTASKIVATDSNKKLDTPYSLSIDGTLSSNSDSNIPSEKAVKTYVDSHSGGGTWGSITGTLSSQTDLQSALDAKEDETNKVTDFTTLNNTLYPTTQAVYNAIQSAILQGSTFVFSGTNSDISGYESMPILSSYSSGALATISQTVTTTPTLLEEFATASGYPNITIISTGLLTCHFETQKSAGSNNYYCYFELYKRSSGGTETLLVTSDNSSQTSVNTVVQQTITGFVSSNISLLSTDRLVVKIYAVMVSSSATITLRYDNNTSARLNLPSSPIGYVPENVANKSTNTSLGTSDVLYPTQNAVKSYVDTGLATKANTSTTISTGTGLTGGGDLSTNRTLSLDINGLTAETSADNADSIAIYDSSASALRKMTRSNFLSGISGGGYSVTTVTSTSSSPSDTIGERILLCDAATAGGNITVNLPTAVSNGAKFTIKKIDSGSNTVIIDPNSTQTVDGLTTFTLYSQHDSITVISDNANWRIVA